MTNNSTGPSSGPLPRIGGPANPNSEYAHHAAPQGLDPYGRSARDFVNENDLDIPSFLRRKARERSKTRRLVQNAEQ